MGRLCAKCGLPFKVRLVVDGRIRNLQRRKYCLTCSPFGSGNRRKLEDQSSVETRAKRRSESYLRWQAKARRARKQKLVDLLGGCCCKCGYNRCLAALDFHHRNPQEKRFQVGAYGLLIKWERLVEEALKCDLICRNCHAELHEHERNGV
jgi:hypothetical protein